MGTFCANGTTDSYAYRLYNQGFDTSVAYFSTDLISAGNPVMYTGGNLARLVSGDLTTRVATWHPYDAGFAADVNLGGTQLAVFTVFNDDDSQARQYSRVLSFQGSGRDNDYAYDDSLSFQIEDYSNGNFIGSFRGGSANSYVMALGPKRVNLIFDGTNCTLRYNGQVVGTVADTRAFAATGRMFWCSDFAKESPRGRFAEFIVQKQTSASDIAKIEASQSAYFGI